MFKSLTLAPFRQFKGINIEFDRHLTIITGSNGAGKTTLLTILSRHFGWSINFRSVFLQFGEEKRRRLASDLENYYDQLNAQPQNTIDIGTLSYTNGKIATLRVPTTLIGSYMVQYDGQQNVSGLHLPSHRPLHSHTEVQHIPTNPRSSAQQYSDYQQYLMQLYTSTSANNPAHVIKSSLIALGVFAYETETVEGNSDYRELFERFQEILKKILPKTLGFSKLRVRSPDLIFITESGTFSFDSMSGGISSLVGIAWQIFMFGWDKKEYVITFDEPENHLHPSMQRELLPSLVNAFPECQFIVTTHSPFVISSLENSRVYALRHNDQNRIVSQYLDLVEKSGTAVEILREVLGVPVTLPIWVEKRIGIIAEKYSQGSMTPQSFAMMKQELASIGLDKYLPEVLLQVLN